MNNYKESKKNIPNQVMVPKYLLICFACFVLMACSSVGGLVDKAVKQPEVSYKSISFGSISKSGVQINPVFAVHNPNPITIPLDQLSYELSFNEKSMLEGVIEDIGKLPARQSRDVTIPLVLSDEVLSSFKELLINNEKLDYQVKGKASLLGFNIPFEKTATFYRPKISFGSINIEESSFDSVQLSMTVMIENPNDFELPLNNMNYSVRSGSKLLFNGGIPDTKLIQGNNQITLPVTVKPRELFNNIFSLMSNPELPLRFSLDSPLQEVDKRLDLDLGNLI